MGPRPGEPTTFPLTRRTWLAGLAALVGGGLRADAGESADLEAARKDAADCGIVGLRTAQAEHYDGIGNAPEGFLDKALEICERLGRDYLEHFRAKGFPDLAWPQGRLAIVALAGAEDFAAFLGLEEADEALGGIYDLDRNRLVVFDARPQGDRAKASAARVNTFTLIHEALHQLTFNTGLLDRMGDVPLCISEGLAMYGEDRKAEGSSPLGQVNRRRLEGLRLARARGQAWIPLATLLAADDAFDRPETQQLAYAEGWILVHHLLQDKRRLPELREYLKAIAPRRDATRRLEDAQAAFGDLGKLDRALRGDAARYVRR